MMLYSVCECVFLTTKCETNCAHIYMHFIFRALCGARTGGGYNNNATITVTERERARTQQLL